MKAIIAAGALLGVLASQAGAQVYSTGCCAAQGDSHPFSGAQSQTAMDFRLGTDATITSGRVFTYLMSSADSATTGFYGDFQWTFFADNAGAPGAVVASGLSAATPVTLQSGGSPYDFAINSVALNANTTYWFSVANADASGTLYDSPLWWAGSFNGNIAPDGCAALPGVYRPNTASSWTPISPTDSEFQACFGNQLAFDLFAAPSTVPEPAPLVLLSTGLAGLIPIVRRSRRRC